MKKIIFFLPALVGGGAERTIVNIANQIDRKSYKVYLMVIDTPNEGKYKDEYSQFVREDVEVINLELAITKRNYPRILWAIVKKVNQIKPDIVMSTMLRPNELLSLASLFFRKSIKVVLRESNNRVAREYSWIERKYIRFMYGKLANRTIALSKGVKRNMVENFGINEKNISVIYNPIDIQNIEAQMRQKELLLEYSGIKIINMGRLTPQKDQKCLIKAIGIVKEQIDCKLYILGKGELEENLKSLVHSQRLDEYVEFMGFQKNPYEILAQGDLFVLSSGWEGFGHVIVEAMVAGIPVVSTDCDYGPGEIITDGYNGVLSPVGDEKELAKHILEIVKDREKMKQFSIRGKERSKDFSVEKIVKQYEAIFERL